MILVCGEALFDVFLTGDNPRGDVSLDARPGGSPFNVAVGLARLGCATGFFGGLSRDMFGARLSNILMREKVDVSRCPVSDAPTTLAFVELGADGAARYAFRGEGAADRQITARDLPALGDDVTALAFGSYSTVVAPAGEALLALAEREQARRVIVYDPNLRPTVISDLDVWRARFDAFAETATIVKVSDEDLRLLAPGASPREFADAALLQGAALVVITLGGDGALAYGAFGAAEQPALATSVVDTVGAGDTVTAALIAWLDQRGLLARDAIAALDSRHIGEALRFAMRAAAVTCSRRGADLPRSQDLA